MSMLLINGVMCYLRSYMTKKYMKNKNIVRDIFLERKYGTGHTLNVMQHSTLRDNPIFHCFIQVSYNVDLTENICNVINLKSNVIND